MLCRRMFAVLPAMFLVLAFAAASTIALPIMDGFEGNIQPACVTAELYRVKVGVGKGPEGKRYILARIDALPRSSALVLSSEAEAAATSEAISLASSAIADVAPILTRSDSNPDADESNAEDNGFDDAIADGADTNDVQADEAETFVSETIRVFENGDAERGDNVLDDLDNNGIRETIITVDEVVVSIPRVPAENGEDGAETENNADTLLTSDDRNNVNEDNLPTRALCGTARPYPSTLFDPTDLSETNFDTANVCVSNTPSVIFDASDDTGALLQYTELGVGTSCDENGNWIPRTVLLLTAYADDTGTPAPSVSTSTLLPSEDDAFIPHECPEYWTDENGNTALHLAANNSLVECFAPLIAAGADLEARNENGETPLFLASRYGNAASVERLVDEGADKEAPAHGGWRPLHTAARNGRVLVVELLLIAGADVDVHSEDGATPLWLAAYYNQGETAKLLVNAGANIHIPAANGITPKGAAFWRQSYDVIDVFNQAENRNDINNDDTENTEDDSNNDLDENDFSDSNRNEEQSIVSRPYRFSMSNLRAETVRQRKEPSGFVPSSFRSSGHHRSASFPELRRTHLRPVQDFRTGRAPTRFPHYPSMFEDLMLICLPVIFICPMLLRLMTVRSDTD